MKKSTSKRSIEDEELEQIDDNKLIRNITSIISQAETLKQKFINIKQPIEGEFSNALDELDLGQELSNQLRITAQNSRELLSDDRWVRKEREKLDSASELMTQIPVVLDGDSRHAEMLHQATIINNSELTRANEYVEDYEQIEKENEINEKDVNERETALDTLDEYITRLENIKTSLISAINNTPSPSILPLTQPLLNRVKSASALANKDNNDQGTHFEPIRLEEVREFETNLNRNVITPILQRSQSAPPTTSEPSKKSQKKGGKTKKRNKNKYKNTRRIKYNAKRRTRRNYKKGKKSSKSKLTIRRRYK